MPIVPMLGFVTGIPILTQTGYEAIENIKPGEMIQA